MIKRLTAIFVISLFVVFIFAGGAFGATDARTAKKDVHWTRHISEDINIDGSGWELYRAPSKPISKYYIPSGAKLTCDDISPSVGIIINHLEIGDTWYDFQKNGSMGRLISVTSDGYRHFSYTWVEGEYPGNPRYVDYQCMIPLGMGVECGGHVDGGDINAGYSNTTHLYDGTGVVIYHRTAPAGPGCWNSAISIDDVVGGCFWTKHWDIPDDIVGAPSAEPAMWPKAEVLYDADGEQDYIHIVMTEGETAGGVPVMVAYERAYRSPTNGDTVYCEACVGGSRVIYGIKNDQRYSMLPISHFDSSCSITPVVAVSPVSKRVAIAFLKPAGDGSCSYLSDACYIESMNNAEDWLSDCANWPPPEENITNFEETDTERCYSDLNACYDYDDSLHIVYVTTGFDYTNPGYYQPGVARLYHWSKKDGNSMVTDAVWEGTDPGGHNLNIAKMSISAKDPIYHPAGDSLYLFCIWTQFDTTTPKDESDALLTNGEIYGCGSFDAGNSWGKVWNLTNTRTPGCAVGECVSEHWSSLAQNMHNGDLHIQYICDRHPGTALPSQDPGSEWCLNPVMYLQLGEWPVGAACRTGWKIVVEDPEIDPPHFYRPPLKVTPGGSRTLKYSITNIGNALCNFSVSSVHTCIEATVPSTNLPIGATELLLATLDGSGTCADTFIEGTISIAATDQTHEVVVRAVVADDYYECPRDPETYDTLENLFLRLYVNANCQEWIHDISTDTTHEVFFQGGTIVATTREGNTLVGRFMGDNDEHAGARDKLYLEQCEPDWEPHFWILYTKNIFMHNLNPPANDYAWYWWEMSKQIKFFKPTAPEDYQRIVIKYITVKRHDPPGWWPEKPDFVGYDNTYIGMAMDVDCPFDSARPGTGDEGGINYGRYDDVNEIFYQVGYGVEHSAYANYHCGIALADVHADTTVNMAVAPYGAHNVKNNQYLYPQSPWGWLDQELYDLASTPGVTIQDGPTSPDSIVDRTWVVTAKMIEAGADPKAESSFVVIEVVAPNGEAQMQTLVQLARTIVVREKALGGIPAICGDANGDQIVNLGDIVYLIGYVFRGGDPPKCPSDRGDANNDGIINLGDIVYLIGFVFRGGSAPVCPGIWY
ncbi:MAG: dockerin type I repeat-containing protein [candidate division Zixibacteria bacterium]|nr:dockerin type I repeat-containing protein [candidate division Zixibacteria bacterium]